MALPLVSVVIPTYNRQDTIAAAVGSALEQSYPRTEVIVVDDGSTDATAAVLRAFGDSVRVIHQENAGPSAARNHGVANARGEILAFLDSDDVWHPEKITRQVRLLEQLGPRVPCCLCNIDLPHAPSGRPNSFALSVLHPEIEEGLWLNPTEVLLTRFLLFNQAVAVRREALEQSGLFNPNLRLLEDYDLALRLSLLGPWGFIRSPLVTYGVSETNSLTRWGSSEAGRVPRVMKGVLMELAARGGMTDSGQHWLLQRQLRCCDRLVRIANLRQSRNRVVARVGRGVGWLSWAWDAAFRRSPWWPKMQVAGIGTPDWAASQTQKFAPAEGAE